MKLLRLAISNFRGVKDADIDLSGNTALVGPNGAGKSTIIDALCLVFGRSKLVPILTEHDFCGSTPSPKDRFAIIVTLGGFEPNDPDRHPDWFRKDRGVPKWWNPASGDITATAAGPDEVLCVQLGFSARFDHDDLEVDARRYFHDSDEIVDPFDDEAIVPVPTPLLNQVGFYVLPARRTWEAAASFGSELFRRTVSGSGAIPASTVLTQRDALRCPTPPLEADPKLKDLTTRMSNELAQLVPGHPQFQLRVTATDTESLLRALVPHYKRDDQPSLPAARQGTGLLALQSFVLLLEVGRARRAKNLSFILALEEPELHIAPGLQRRIITRARAVADQVLCTTHSPDVAAAFPAESVRILRPSPVRLNVSPLLSANAITAPNADRRLAQDFRPQVVDALMHDIVLVPEGRIDHEWLRLLSTLVLPSGGSTADISGENVTPPFGTVVGTIPTKDASVKESCLFLGRLHDRVVALVDGDAAGDAYVRDLACLPLPPTVVMQWPVGWMIEDVVGWIAQADETAALRGIAERMEQPPIANSSALVQALKTKERASGGLKENYLAYQDIAAAFAASPACVARTEQLLGTVVRAAFGTHEKDPCVERLPASTSACSAVRLHHEPRAL